MFLNYLVRRRGIEPPRANAHTALNRACLPVPAPARLSYYARIDLKVKSPACW